MFVDGWPELTEGTAAEYDRLIAAGRPESADLLKAAYVKFAANLRKMETTVSTKGTEILREHERNSRVRPAWAREADQSISANLFCDPLGIALPGSVGVANKDELEATVWWWVTNEEGSDGRLGGVLHGYFQPGTADPDSSEDRKHPIFESTPGDESALYRSIVNPIPERRFVEHSIPEIRAVWESSFGTLFGEFIGEIDAALAIPAPLPEEE